MLKKFARYLCVIIGACLMITSLTSCAALNSVMKDIKGELVGNRFDIDFYDNFGNKIVSMDGHKVGLETNYVKSKSVDSDGTTTTNYEPSSVITITIDGHQVAQTGNTVIFVEDGIEKLEDFNLSDITTNGEGTINIFDRNINKIKNLLGTPKVIVVCSQLGVPIAVYGGNEVYWEVPSDLPKMTKLNVDGLALYIHRANYILLDNDMIK